MSIVGPILYHARTRPDALALVHADATLTYCDLAGAVAHMTAYLRRIDVGPGDRIGLCLKDTPAHVVALLAAAEAGAVAMPLDWRARPHETQRFVTSLGVRCVLAEPDAPLTADCPVLALDATWQHAAAAADIGADAARDWDAPFVIAASSGSTGAPKFTQMTHRQFYFAIAGMFELTPLVGRHRFLCALPLYYAAGRANCIAHLLRGDCVILYPQRV